MCREKGLTVLPQEKYGVLLVAGGLTHQENYVSEFLADKRCRLIGLTDEEEVPRDRAVLNEGYSRELNIPYIPKLEDALRMPGVDVVSICAEPERRGRIVARCAREGKHVYIDKPMTPYLSAADAAVRAVEENGVKSQMYSFINKAWCRRAKSVVDSGVLGEVASIHADVFFAKGHPGTADIRRQRKLPYPPERFTFVDSKSEIYAIGVYALGLLCWLSGRRVESVYCSTRNYFFAEHQNNRQEDFGTLAMKLEGDVTATVCAGRIGWESHPAGGENKMLLIGTKGSSWFDANRMRMENHGKSAHWQPPQAHPDDPMGFWRSTGQASGVVSKDDWSILPSEEAERGDANFFIDCIEKGTESDMNVRAAAHLTEVILAGYKSAQTGELVSLPLER